MKKLFAIPLMLLPCMVQLNAQSSQRLVLIEEHSSASCPPSAIQNPAFFTLMNANKAKAVLLYYPWNFGYDPMHDDNPTEAQARALYNSISYKINSIH